MCICTYLHVHVCMYVHVPVCLSVCLSLMMERPAVKQLLSEWMDRWMNE